jgi:hypothetical protein
MAKGGKRSGAGRPIGSTNKLSLRDYIEKEDNEEFFDFVLSTYKESEKLTVWLGDQLKASQQMEISGPEGEPLAANLSASDRKAIDSLRDLLKQRAALATRSALLRS